MTYQDNFLCFKNSTSLLGVVTSSCKSCFKVFLISNKSILDKRESEITPSLVERVFFNLSFLRQKSLKKKAKKPAKQNKDKNDRARKLHLQPVGSETGAFLCGRIISEDYKEFTGTIVCDGWKCKQCDSCRPLHDVGSMVAHLDCLEAKRASDRRLR